MAIGFRTSKMVSSSPRSKRPFAVRSVMSAVSGRVCEGMWLQRVRGGGQDSRVGCSGGSRRKGSPRVGLVPSHDGCNSTRCLRGVLLQRSRHGPEQWFAG